MSSLKVLKAGPCTTVQDLGRSGFLNRGVSGSGAMDPIAHRIANALVGNEPNAATIEFAYLGGTYEVLSERAAIAVAGAMASIYVNDDPRPMLQTVFVEKGDIVTIHATRLGIYGYLGIAGGVLVPPVFGSRSTHLRSGLGGLEGRTLQSGDILPILDKFPGDLKALHLNGMLEREAEEFRVTLGPQLDSFTEQGIESFLGEIYKITEGRDRMAQMLDGPMIGHRDGFNIVSDGIAPGAIQVAGTQKPMVLLAERQTTGGYPKIANMISADLPYFVQLPIDENVQFKAVAIGEAEFAARRNEQRIADAVASIKAVPTQVQISSEWLLENNLIDGVTYCIE